MSEKLKVSLVINASQKEIYDGWLDSKGHAEFTGSPAEVDPKVGGKFTAWDGYIWGKTLELEPYKRILQTWRTTEFPENAPDSLLEVLIEPVEGGCELTLVHTNIPDGQTESYRQGWLDFYFEPMKEHFGKH